MRMAPEVVRLIIREPRLTHHSHEESQQPVGITDADRQQFHVLIRFKGCKQIRQSAIAKTGVQGEQKFEQVFVPDHAAVQFSGRQAEHVINP